MSTVPCHEQEKSLYDEIYNSEGYRQQKLLMCTSTFNNSIGWSESVLMHTISQIESNSSFYKSNSYLMNKLAAAKS